MQKRGVTALFMSRDKTTTLVADLQSDLGRELMPQSSRVYGNEMLQGGWSQCACTGRPHRRSRASAAQKIVCPKTVPPMKSSFGWNTSDKPMYRSLMMDTNRMVLSMLLWRVLNCPKSARDPLKAPCMAPVGNYFFPTNMCSYSWTQQKHFCCQGDSAGARFSFVYKYACSQKQRDGRLTFKTIMKRNPAANKLLHQLKLHIKRCVPMQLLLCTLFLTL